MMNFGMFIPSIYLKKKNLIASLSGFGPIKIPACKCERYIFKDISYNFICNRNKFKQIKSLSTRVLICTI